MKKTFIALLVLVLGCHTSGCHALFGGPPIEVEIYNFSSEDLLEARAYFGEAICGWGIVVTQVSASHMSFSQPITDDAVLTWRDSKGLHREQVNLRSVFQRGVRGRLSFRVYNDRIDVRFFPKR
jgi:hypothetical protein